MKIDFDDMAGNVKCGETEEDARKRIAAKLKRVCADNADLRDEIERLNGLNDRNYAVSCERANRERGERKPKDKSGFAFTSKCAPFPDRFSPNYPNCNPIAAWCVTLASPWDADMPLADVMDNVAYYLPDVLEDLGVRYFFKGDSVFHDMHDKELFDKLGEVNKYVENGDCICYRVTFEQDTRTRLWCVRLFLTAPLPCLDL